MVISRLRKVYRGLKGLWELLKRKKVNKEFITKDHLNTYKKILTMNNAHLNRYQPDDNINISRGKNFRGSIAPLFAKPKGRGIESALRRMWTKY